MNAAYGLTPEEVRLMWETPRRECRYLGPSNRIPPAGTERRMGSPAHSIVIALLGLGTIENPAESEECSVSRRHWIIGMTRQPI